MAGPGDRRLLFADLALRGFGALTLLAPSVALGVVALFAGNADRHRYMIQLVATPFLVVGGPAIASAWVTILLPVERAHVSVRLVLGAGVLAGVVLTAWMFAGTDVNPVTFVLFGAPALGGLALLARLALSRPIPGVGRREVGGIEEKAPW